MPAITHKSIVLAAADYMDKYGRTNFVFVVANEESAERASHYENQRVGVGACCLIGAIGQGYLAIGGKCESMLPYNEPLAAEVCHALEGFLCTDLHSFTSRHTKEQCVEALRNFALTLE